MVIAFAVFPYLVGGLVMWLIAHQVAPVGYSVSITRCFFALVLMSCGQAVAQYFLSPVLGQGRCYLAKFGVAGVLGMMVLQLGFWRSLLAVVVYDVVFIAVGVGIAIYNSH